MAKDNDYIRLIHTPRWRVFAGKGPVLLLSNLGLPAPRLTRNGIVTGEGDIDASCDNVHISWVFFADSFCNGYANGRWCTPVLRHIAFSTEESDRIVYVLFR